MHVDGHIAIYFSQYLPYLLIPISVRQYPFSSPSPSEPLSSPHPHTYPERPETVSTQPPEQASVSPSLYQDQGIASRYHVFFGRKNIHHHHLQLSNHSCPIKISLELHDISQKLVDDNSQKHLSICPAKRISLRTISPLLPSYHSNSHKADY